MPVMQSHRVGSGKPLLLVHGLGSSYRNWDPVVPALAARRELIAVDLPGFDGTPPLEGEVSIATLVDALTAFIDDEGLQGIDLVGSSVGARLVLELARRGVGGTCVALSPGGFWDRRQLRLFDGSLRASVALVRALHPALPVLLANPVGRTALLSQFSAHPWSLPAGLVTHELLGFSRQASPSLDDVLDSLVHGPDQQGAPAGTTPGLVFIGWGRQDRVCLPSQSERATSLFPDAQLHWFDHCGHFPHWDQPQETARLVLAATA